MITIPTNARFPGVHNVISRGLPHVIHTLRLTFIIGPKKLLTSRISVKCAAIMVAMCAPSILFCAILTIPAMIFQSPQQNAYFQFSEVLESDSSRWFVLVLAGLCSLLSLAVPATMPAPKETDLY